MSPFREPGVFHLVCGLVAVLLGCSGGRASSTRVAPSGSALSRPAECPWGQIPGPSSTEDDFVTDEAAAGAACAETASSGCFGADYIYEYMTVPVGGYPEGYKVVCTYSCCEDPL
jgi:hypothetical protein